MNKIGIIDADLLGRKRHRFPNLACMKLSSFYKKSGYDVKLLLSWDDIVQYDMVFISKAFTDTSIPDGVLNLANVKYGGTGFYYDNAEQLSDEIEHEKPDYHLYDDFVSAEMDRGAKEKEFEYYTKYSIGFTTRGCIRGCSFCVNKNYKQCLRHSPVSEFLDESRPYICLLDDNVLACKDWKEIFTELNATGKRFQFKQGMDERLLTDEKCEIVFGSKWIGDYIFAFDNIKDRSIIEKKLQLMRKHTNRVPKFYVFCSYNHDEPGIYTERFWVNDIADIFERIKVLMSYRALPYIMRFKDYENSPYRGMYVTLARWCNQPSFLKKKSFREFCIASGGASERYMRDFESKYPGIAEDYFDMKWSDLDEQNM